METRASTGKATGDKEPPTFKTLVPTGATRDNRSSLRPGKNTSTGFRKGSIE